MIITYTKISKRHTFEVRRYLWWSHCMLYECVALTSFLGRGKSFLIPFQDWAYVMGRLSLCPWGCTLRFNLGPSFSRLRATIDPIDDYQSKFSKFSTQLHSPLPSWSIRCIVDLFLFHSDFTRAGNLKKKKSGSARSEIHLPTDFYWLYIRQLTFCHWMLENGGRAGQLTIQ